MTNSITAEMKLLAVIETLFSPTSVQNDPLATARRTVIEHLRRIQLRHNYSGDQSRLSPKQLPVCRYLVHTLDGPAANAPFVTAFRPLLPTLAWIQNPNYRQDNMPPDFLENYGYADIISARGSIPDPTFALGILLLGPHTEYPPHHHPAEEVYYTISGSAHWWQTDQTWTHRPPGSFIYHPSGVAHAMRTHTEPVCLLYAWWGDVQTAARLTKMKI